MLPASVPKSKFQIRIYFTLSNKLEVYEFMTSSSHGLWAEAGGILFLIHLAVSILMKPYAALFLQRDILNKAFKVDTKVKD